MPWSRFVHWCFFASSWLLASAEIDVGLAPGLTKEEQIKQKNSNVDTVGVWRSLPKHIQKSMQDASKCSFVDWLGYGVTKGKAAIVTFFTPEEADGMIASMSTSGDRPGVMTANKTLSLYAGRLNTTRHLISDKTLADHILRRMRICPSDEGIPFLSFMHFGNEIAAVGDKIRLVTTGSGGAHQTHADISEPSDDGLRVSVLTFQCYLNPEAYEGGQFQLYPDNGPDAVNIPISKGGCVVFVQEDDELQHGGAKHLSGSPKCAIRGNLDVVLRVQASGEL